MEHQQKRWYAIYARHNTEFKIESFLTKEGYTCYLPSHTIYREHKGKRICIERPLIPGMVFVHISSEEIPVVEQFPNVYRFFTHRSTHAPVTIPDKQMEEFRFMKDLSDEPVRIVADMIPEGTPVTIIKGSMQGIQGEMVKYDKHYCMVVRLNDLGCALVNIPVSHVRRNK